MTPSREARVIAEESHAAAQQALDIRRKEAESVAAESDRLLEEAKYRVGTLDAEKIAQDRERLLAVQANRMRESEALRLQTLTANQRADEATQAALHVTLSPPSRIEAPPGKLHPNFDPSHDDVVRPLGITVDGYVRFRRPLAGQWPGSVNQQAIYLPYYVFEIKASCTVYYNTAEGATQTSQLKEGNTSMLQYPASHDFRNLAGQEVVLELSNGATSAGETIEMKIKERAFRALQPACTEAETAVMSELHPASDWTHEYAEAVLPSYPRAETPHDVDVKSLDILPVTFTARRRWNQCVWRMWKRSFLDMIFDVVQVPRIAKMMVRVTIQDASERIVLLPVYTAHIPKISSQGVILVDGAMCGFTGRALTK
jgi:hypothetical protein